MNHIAQYSISKYETAQPIAFSNWVTTDLLDHPAEPFIGEDAVSINPNHIFANKNYPSGAFASYHVYPYYPDFLNFDPDKANFKDHRGQSNSYAAYLKDLHDSHEMPVVISEFGIPGSRGISHKNIHGKDQGHMNEDEQGKRNAELFEDIIQAKLLAVLYSFGKMNGLNSLGIQLNMIIRKNAHIGTTYKFLNNISVCYHLNPILLMSMVIRVIGKQNKNWG